MDRTQRDFTAFVQDRISRGEVGDLGLTEVFDLWMLHNPTYSEREINIAANVDC